MTGFRELIALHLAQQRENDARSRQERLRATIAALDEKLGAAKGEFDAADEAFNSAEVEKRRLEGEVEQLEAARQKYRAQLMEAKTNEVYKTLLSEIETAKARVSERETSILELIETMDELAARRSAAEDVLAQARAERDDEARQLEDEIQSLETVRSEALELVEVRRTAVRREHLRLYDRVVHSRGGKGMARADDQLCTECHVAIRPQLWVELLREAIHTCSGCGRILYRPENIPAESEGDAPAGEPNVPPAEASG